MQLLWSEQQLESKKIIVPMPCQMHKMLSLLRASASYVRGWVRDKVSVRPSGVRPDNNLFLRTVYEPTTHAPVY